MEIAGFVLKSPRRIIHRPKFDILERRILPTLPAQVIPLADGQGPPAALLPGSDGDLWVVMSSGKVVDHVAADGSVTEVWLGPTSFANYDENGEGDPIGATLGPDGNLWISGPEDVARVTPDGVVTTFAINVSYLEPPPGDIHSTIVAGPDGALWFGDILGSVGRITTDGVISLYPLPDTDDVATSITAGPDGALWFTAGSEIGRIATNGTMELFPSEYGLYVDDITAGPDGNLWFSANTETFGEIGRITPEGQQAVLPLPSGFYTQAVSLTVGPDGAIWFDEQMTSPFYLDPPVSQIGRIDVDGDIAEYPLPSPHSSLDTQFYDPVEMSFGSDGSLWYSSSFSEAAASDNTWDSSDDTPEELVRIDPSDFASVEVQTPSTPIVTSPDFSGELATFAPIDPSEPASAYSSTIDWGDGSTAPGFVVSTSPDSFEVDGSHTFQGTGSFTVSITVTPPSTSTLSFILPTVVRETLMVDPPGGPPTSGDVPSGPSTLGDTSGGSPTLVREPATIYGPKGPVPGPAPVSDASSPPLLPPAVYLVDPTLLTSDPSSTATPPSPSPPTAIPSDPAVVASARTDQPRSVAVSTPISNPSGVVPLVVVEEISTPPAGASATGSALVPVATGLAPTPGASNRAGKPVPTLGLAPSRLPRVQPSARPAPKPLRVARANLPDLDVVIQPAPEAGQVVSAP
jgi:virginiamycin B lyase